MHHPTDTYHGLCYTSRGALAGTRKTTKPTFKPLSDVRRQCMQAFILSCSARTSVRRDRVTWVRSNSPTAVRVTTQPSSRSETGTGEFLRSAMSCSWGVVHRKVNLESSRSFSFVILFCNIEQKNTGTSVL